MLVAILRTSSLRSPSTVFLCSLAVSDLLVGMVVQPFYIAHQLNPGLRLKDAFDAYSSLSCGVSLCKVTAISVDRFLALHYHMRYPNLMTDNRAMYISLSLWFLMILASCLYVWNMTYARLTFVPGIVICILVSTFLYITIYQIARRHQHQQTVQTVGVDHNLNLLRSQRSAINTSIYYVCMILCYFSLIIKLLVLIINRRFQRQEWDLTFTVVYMNSSINPILYCWRLREL